MDPFKSLYLSSEQTSYTTSVTRLGDFESFGKNISSKRSPNDWQLFGLFRENLHWLLFGQLLVKFGQLFISTSGHTVHVSTSNVMQEELCHNFLVKLLKLTKKISRKKMKNKFYFKSADSLLLSICAVDIEVSTQMSWVRMSLCLDMTTQVALIAATDTHGCRKYGFEIWGGGNRESNDT